MEIQIRSETSDDFVAINNLLEKAFGQPNEAGLVDNFRKSDSFIPELALVAQQSNQIIGHIVFTHIHIETKTNNKNIPALALAPMAVIPAMQNKGIGSALVRKGLILCREVGHQIVIVLGHEKYYPKFGFLPASKYNITPPFEAPDEAFMALALQPNTLKFIFDGVLYGLVTGVAFGWLWPAV